MKLVSNGVIDKSRFNSLIECRDLRDFFIVQYSFFMTGDEGQYFLTSYFYCDFSFQGFKVIKNKYHQQLQLSPKPSPLAPPRHKVPYSLTAISSIMLCFCSFRPPAAKFTETQIILFRSCVDHCVDYTPCQFSVKVYFFF